MTVSFINVQTTLWSIVRRRCASSSWPSPQLLSACKSAANRPVGGGVVPGGGGVPVGDGPVTGTVVVTPGGTDVGGTDGGGPEQYVHLTSIQICF